MTDLVEVIQADRDAVKAFHNTRLDKLMHDIKHRSNILEAKGDDSDDLVQAFARHRIAHSVGVNITDLSLRNAREWIEKGTTFQDGERCRTGWARAIDTLLSALTHCSATDAALRDALEKIVRRTSPTFERGNMSGEEAASIARAALEPAK